MPSTTDPALVSTQGATRYTAASVNRTKYKAVQPKKNKKAKHGTSIPSVAISSATKPENDGVCRVPYSNLDSTKVIGFELMRGERGTYKYVQHTANGQFEVTYFNAELGKTVFLGRFTDECTASFAHALARSDLTCRTVDRAAQSLIESLFVQNASQTSIKTLARQELPIPTAAMSKQPVEEELDFDSLFEEIVNAQDTDVNG